MDENVVQMPSKLERLAVRIKDDLKKRTESDEAWVTATIDLGACLVEARGEFDDNISFGKWCDGNAIYLGHQDRAALIEMARNPDRLREVLEATNRRSLQHIYYEEYRVTQVSKTIDTATGKLKVTVPTQKALDALKRLRAKGAKITQKTVAKEAGVSETSVRRAFTMEQAVAAAGKQAQPTGLSRTDESKLDAYKRQLERDIEAKVAEAVRERLTTILANVYNDLDARLKKFEAVVNRKFPFNRAEYKKLLMVLHPDNIASKEIRDEVFKFVNDREIVLQPDVKTDLAEKARAARQADMEKAYEQASAWFKANPGKKKWPGPGAT
jgi:AraC-like DNA-binding protein